MGMTMTQKILAAAAGLEKVEAGQLIEADLDLVLGNDITTPVAIREMDKMTVNTVFDKDKIALVAYVDNKIVGIIDFRHHINHPILGTWGGHCGYSVRPSERGKGYAKEMLRLNIQNAKCRYRQ